MSRGWSVRGYGLRLQTLLSFSPSVTSGQLRTVHRWSHRRTTTTLSVEAKKESGDSKRKKKEKVLVISGPTGAGKSRLALDLARRLNGQIISADSVQVYRGLDIGSAKPSTSEREEVPHHLIDILHPSEDYSVGQFFEDARQATEDIIRSGNVPIIVGGTGLYLRWYIYGKPEVPKASLKIAAEVDSELLPLQRQGDWCAAVQLLEKAGDPKAHLVPSNDWYRLRRSLEIIKSTGSPPSAFSIPYDSFREQLESRASDSSPDSVSSSNGPSEDLDYDFICFFLSSQRTELYRMIDLRCEEMLKGNPGVLTEASWLLDIGLLPNSNSATRAIGYRQVCLHKLGDKHAMEYLLSCRQEGGRTSPGDFYAFLTEFQKASRNFAKRQMTWFRNEHIYQWLDASQPLERVLDFIVDAYFDENGRVVPEQLKMHKDICSPREAYELKSYQTRRRYFSRRDDCSGIMDWILRTQRL
ncbi:tRNA dimethylallyltransferase 9 isoform X2 [Nymphaea colorata]|uniref:tRNA dimethylallyltransferase 9 isoform X2 n=1 Tax=Nymphaea colorata TaxID=210225 RepID=UPI00129E5408|nr:tRNA dimethylallyltransferase 9 isoform X2 [Nymphaea colorata]